ncbi:MAG: N-formylglutamate amidohydrolase [Pseudomonadota bacterium]
MLTDLAVRATLDPPFAVLAPARQTAPVVFASPHSGDAYPAEFIAQSRLDPLTLRRSEDAFVDQLFALAPQCGSPLISALFPRAYVDPNREPFELDPAMFEDELPAFVNVGSPRVAAGLGTIARVVATGAEIYKAKLCFADATARIDALWRPYHAKLAALLVETQARFGYAALVDCHSMPAIGGPMDRDPGRRRVDVVLGDCHGTSCAPQFVDAVEAHLKALGYAVARNDPYAGGFTTRHYGRPGAGRHALQIEINRALYMDEARIEKTPGFAILARHVGGLVRAIGEAALKLAIPR